MGRGRVQRKLIENRNLRDTTYRKRIQGLKRKTYELATLCDIPALLISFGPDGHVETWPESSEEIKDILRTYNSKSGSKVSNRNELDAEGFLQLEIRRKRKELNRVAMDSVDRLQELIKSVDVKLGELDQTMQLLGNKHFTGILEEQKPMLLESLKGDEMENCNCDIGFEPDILEALPALENDGTVHDYPDIGFWEQIASGTSVSDTLEIDDKMFEEESMTDSFGLKDCLDDNPNGVGFDSVFTPTGAMALSTAFPLTEQANTLDQDDGFHSLYYHKDFSSSSLAATPFSASFGGVDSQFAADDHVQCPHKASTCCYEQASVTDELLPEDVIFDNCRFMGYYHAQPLWRF